MNFIKSILPLLIIFLLISLVVIGVTKNRSATKILSIDGSYTIYSDGTVIDKNTGLMWKRCSEGQTWAAGVCEGKASGITWHHASKNGLIEFAGYSDWRLPQLAELLQLVVRDGSTPTINQNVFPLTEDSPYWTDLTKFYEYDPDNTYAWFVNFDTGNSNFGGTTYPFYARLVRDVH